MEMAVEYRVLEGGRFTSFTSGNDILNAIRESRIVPMTESTLCPL